MHCLDKEGVLHEGQAGFRVDRSCMDNVYTIVQGRLKEDKETYAFFLNLEHFRTHIAIADGERAVYRSMHNMKVFASLITSTYSGSGNVQYTNMHIQA